MVRFSHIENSASSAHWTQPRVTHRPIGEKSTLPRTAGFAIGHSHEDATHKPAPRKLPQRKYPPHSQRELCKLAVFDAATKMTHASQHYKNVPDLVAVDCQREARVMIDARTHRGAVTSHAHANTRTCTHAYKPRKGTFSHQMYARICTYTQDG